MKSPLRALCSGLLLVVGLCVSSFAQPAGGGNSGPQFGTDPVLKELFKAFPAFSGDMAISMTQRGKSLTMEAHLDMSKGVARMEIDMTKMKSPDIPPGAMDQMIGLGFNPMVTLSNEADGSIIIIYPTLKAYATQRLPKPPASAKPVPETKATMTTLGEETVAGHPCVKRKVTLTLAPGKAKDAMVWQAKDLKDFPVKLEYKEGADTVSLTFAKVNLTSPAAALFSAPAGYTSYPSIQELMQNEMMKSMGNMQ